MQTKNKIIRIADEKYLNEVLAGPLGDTVLEIEEGVYRLCRPLVLKDVQNFTLHGNGNVRLEGGERFRGGFKRAPQGENVFVKKLAAGARGGPD